VFYNPKPLAINSGGSPHSVSSITHLMCEVDFIKKDWSKGNLFWGWKSEDRCVEI